MIAQRMLSLLPEPMSDLMREVAGYRLWRQRNFEAPSPAKVKRNVLLRNAIPGAPWIETGTYLGDTTMFLARRFPRVVTLEPSAELCERARRRFAGMPQVEVVNDISENVFPKLLPQLSGALNFWLDGHFSAGPTHRGPKDTPIIEELASIQANLSRFPKIAVLVDDVRCFDPTLPEFAGYPERDMLVDWARNNGLNWSIEHDIFVASRR